MFNDPSTNVYYDYKIQEDILHNIELELSNYTQAISQSNVSQLQCFLKYSEWAVNCFQKFMQPWIFVSFVSRQKIMKGKKKINWSSTYNKCIEFLFSKI